jgi:hypothetical protein
MTRCFIVLFLATSSLYATTNEEAPSEAVSLLSNGNEGVGESEQVFLLDLVEWGVEKTATFNPEIKEGMPLFEELRSRVLNKLDGVVDEKAVDILVYKIAEVSRVAPYIAFQILAVLEQMDWRLVNMPLETILGIPSPIKLGEKSVLIANRHHRVVRIHRKTFEKMDLINQAALILHEATSPILKVIWNYKRIGHKNVQIGSQNWNAGRDFVGAVFSPYRNKEELISRILKLSDHLQQHWLSRAITIESQLDAYKVELDSEKQNSFDIHFGIGFQQNYSKQYLEREYGSPLDLTESFLGLIRSAEPFLSNQNFDKEKTYSSILCDNVRSGLKAQGLSPASNVDINVITLKTGYYWKTYVSEKWGDISYIAPYIDEELDFSTKILKEKAVTGYNAGVCESDPSYAEDAIKKAFEDWAKPVLKQSLFTY